MDQHTKIILLNSVPLLVLAGLYLGAAAALSPVFWRERQALSWSGVAVWLLYVSIGSLAAVIGAGKLDDASYLGGLNPWVIFALALLGFAPALIVFARWRDRTLLITAGSRALEAEATATERGREVESISRLAVALAGTVSAREAAEHLFDELESVLGFDAVLLAVIDEENRQARGFASRGVDPEWWRGITVDLEHEPGGITTVARERTGYAVYDVGAAANINRRLATAVGAKSAAFVPLISEGRVTGVLTVATTGTHRFVSPSELDMVQRLANETALALGRTRSSDQLAAALERERLVAEISRKVRSETDLDAVLQVAVTETGRAVGVSRCFIRLGDVGEPDPIKAEWDAPGVGAIDPESAKRLPVLNLAARERATIACGDVVNDPRLADPTLGGRETLLALGTRAVLATPIVVFDQMIGVFGLHRPEAIEWSAFEVGLADAVAGEIAVAIHTARLLAEDERRLENQAALLKAAQVVTSDLRFESVINLLVKEMMDLLRADAVDCWLLEPDQRTLRCHAVLGVPEGNVGREIPVEGTIQRTIVTARPVLKHDFARTEDPPASADYAIFYDVMDAPITWLGEVRGVLGVCSRDPRFAEADLELLDAFARFASLALHNAESFEARERQAQIQRGFYRIAEVLGSPLSLSETLDALAQAAAEALGGSAALVLEPAGQGLRLVGSHELPAGFAARLAGDIPDPPAPFLVAASEGRVVTASALGDDERFDEDWRKLFAEAGYQALLTAPVAGGGIEGKAVVVLFDEPRDFSDDDLALASHLTGAARGALERSELFETERRARAFSQRLAAIGALLVTNLDPSVVVDEVVREAPVLLAADAAAVRVREGDEVLVRAAAGPGTEGLIGSSMTLDVGILGEVARARAPASVEDVRAAPRLARGDPLLDATMAATVAVPMIAHGGGLHGLLSVYSARPRSWRDDEVQALATLAAAASAALSSAELYKRVAEEKERSDAILANIADGIVAVDREGRIVLWNRMAEQITGVPVVEALGRRLQDVLQRELAGDGEAPWQRQIAILRGGKEVWLSLTEAVMTDAAGAEAGRIYAFRDVSSERVVEQMKSDFVSTVSHELRTPLTSIYGFAETLLRRDVAFGEEERATFLGYIASESERLIGIVDNLLNVARLEAGTLSVNVRDTDVGEVVTDAVALLEQSENGHRFVVDLPPGELRASADPEKLSQIVLQLLDNAAKFSPEGRPITVSARRKTDSVEVRVVDQGVGIPHADLARVFTKFYRGVATPGSEAPGAGLGLFLVRGLLAAMDGRIWVDSAEGEGSTFSFELPTLHAASQQVARVGTAARL